MELHHWIWITVGFIVLLNCTSVVADIFSWFKLTVKFNAHESLIVDLLNRVSELERVVSGYEARFAIQGARLKDLNDAVRRLERGKVGPIHPVMTPDHGNLCACSQCVPNTFTTIYDIGPSDIPQGHA